MKDQEIRLQILVPHAAFLRQPNRAELQIESQKTSFSQLIWLTDNIEFK